MLYPEFKKMGIGLVDGVEESKVYPICNICNSEETEEVIKCFQTYKYDLSKLHLASFRLFSLNSKELERIKSVLDRVQELNLNSVIQENLYIITLKDEVIDRIKICMDNNLPFCYQDSNILIGEVYDEELFQKYTSGIKQTSGVETKSAETNAVNSEVTPRNIGSEIATNKGEEIVLDEEDANVRSEILKTLLEIKDQNKNDFTFNMIIMTIITEIDKAIAKDNKNYRIMGTRHLIEDVLQGINLDPVMFNEVDTKILSAFPDHENTLGVERGVA